MILLCHISFLMEGTLKLMVYTLLKNRFKVTQCADDTTIILEESVSSLLYKSQSGLKNCGKTKFKKDNKNKFNATSKLIVYRFWTKFWTKIIVRQLQKPHVY